MANSNPPRRRHQAFLDVRGRLRRISGMSVVDGDDVHRKVNNVPTDTDNSSNSSTSAVTSSPPAPAAGFTRAHMHHTASAQPLSPLLSRLPLEIRRIIYGDVWRAHLGPDLRIHIYAAARAAGLMHTACICGSDGDDPDDDPISSDPWPAWRGAKQPPDWFWHAWSLRLRWGRHWKCQEKVMLQWQTTAGGGDTVTDNRPGRGGDKTPYLNVFLTCKMMYVEAIESLFEMATPVFTASEDAYRFFIQQPHPYLSSIRQLDFCFTHYKDHLFLFHIDSKHPQLACCQTVPIGFDVFNPLLACVKEKLPELRSLKIYLAQQAHGREEKFLRLLDALEMEGVLKVEKKVQGERHVVMSRRN